MKAYRSKYSQIPGTDYAEITRNARAEYVKVQKLTKRQPYARSDYFKKDKIFINIFWNHLAQKRKGEQTVRAKLLLAAFDLLRNTTFDPDTIFSKANLNLMLHRFAGETGEGILFYVQVKQDKRSGRKDFMSVFPARSKRK